MVDFSSDWLVAGRQIIDLTQPLEPGDSVYPGDPALRYRPHAALEDAGYRLTEVTLGSHHGTHVDAPSHFLAAGATVERLLLDAMVGPASVVDIPGVPDMTIEPETLAPYEESFRPGARVLLRSGWDVHYGSERYWHGFPSLSPAAAQWMVERELALLGLDTPSPSRDTQQVHRILLAAPRPVVVVESLTNLARLPSRVILVVLPLRLVGLDGSPARAIALI